MMWIMYIRPRGCSTRSYSSDAIDMVASTIPPKENSADGLSQGEGAPEEPVAVELRARYVQ